MAYLNPRYSALALDELHNARQWFNMLVAPDAGIAGRYAAGARYRSGLHHDETDAANRTTAGMHEVPVIGEALMGRILTHGRHGDAAAEGNLPDGKWAKEIDLCDLAIIVATCPTTRPVNRKRQLHSLLP
jgi:hypothetical protein